MLKEKVKSIYNISRYRDVAQLGSALPWGGRGREFKSHRSDQVIKIEMINHLFFLFYSANVEDINLI